MFLELKERGVSDPKSSKSSIDELTSTALSSDILSVITEFSSKFDFKGMIVEMDYKKSFKLCLFGEELKLVLNASKKRYSNSKYFLFDKAMITTLIKNDGHFYYNRENEGVFFHINKRLELLEADSINFLKSIKEISSLEEAMKSFQLYETNKIGLHAVDSYEDLGAKSVYPEDPDYGIVYIFCNEIPLFFKGKLLSKLDFFKLTRMCVANLNNQLLACFESSEYSLFLSPLKLNRTIIENVLERNLENNNRKDII